MSFEIRSAEMLALLYAQKALAKMMSCTGEVRPLSVTFPDPSDGNNGLKEFRVIKMEVKLRNPFSLKPNTASVTCTLDRLRGDSEWELNQLLVNIPKSPGDFITSRDFHSQDFDF
jgi:hypothetical protein